MHQTAWQHRLLWVQPNSSLEGNNPVCRLPGEDQRRTEHRMGKCQIRTYRQSLPSFGYRAFRIAAQPQNKPEG